MAIAIIIMSIALWIISGWLLFARQALAPAASYLALFCLSFATGAEGVRLLPINTTILISWMAIAMVTVAIGALQPAAIAAQKRGVGYMLAGAVTGLMLGLLVSSNADERIAVLHGITIVSIIVGTAVGFLLFTYTPQGRDVGIPTGRFLPYLLAKGFPTAVSVMMAGIALTLWVAMR